MRKRYLIAYDISDDKRRTAAFKTLMDNGDHVQFSVFLCDLNDKELAELKGKLSQTINHREDQVLVLRLGSTDDELRAILHCIGRSYEPPLRTLVI